MPKHFPEHYLPKQKMPREVIWHQLLKILAKAKNFLRLSNKQPLVALSHRIRKLRIEITLSH